MIGEGALLGFLFQTCAIACSRSATLRLHKVRVIGAQQICSLVLSRSSWSHRRQNFLCLDLRSLYYAFRSLSKDTVSAPVTGSEEELVLGGGTEDETFPIALSA